MVQHCGVRFGPHVEALQGDVGEGDDVGTTDGDGASLAPVVDRPGEVSECQS